MKFEAASTLLREQVNGTRTVAKDGHAAVDLPGLLQIVQARVQEPMERERALIALGFILGTASMLQGLTDSKGQA